MFGWSQDDFSALPRAVSLSWDSVEVLLSRASLSGAALAEEIGPGDATASLLDDAPDGAYLLC